jgi:hypothetical protein
VSQAVYEKDNIWWRIGKAQQMLAEWWEKQSYGFKDDLKDWSIPSWLTDFLWEFAKVFSWIILAFLLVWIVWKISPSFRDYFANLFQQIKSDRTYKKQRKTLNISVADWWQKAQKFQASGNYTEAIFCLYAGALQRLNDRGIAANLPSRTDGEYLKIVDRLLHSTSYQVLFEVHQDLCFGGTKADLNLWQRYSQAYQNLEREN